LIPICSTSLRSSSYGSASQPSKFPIQSKITGRGAKAAAPKPNGRRRAKKLPDGPLTIAMNGFSYVYILESLSVVGGYYVGLADDIGNRLVKHNEGGVTHTARLRPWRLKTAVAFRDRDKAAAFEKYLKSPSGRAFAKKRV